MVDEKAVMFFRGQYVKLVQARLKESYFIVE
jgi:hypothetical protein